MTLLEQAQEDLVFWRGQLKLAVVEEYTSTRSGQRNSLKRASLEAIEKQVAKYERQVARLSGVSRVNAGAPK